jgi:hypothetical protein
VIFVVNRLSYIVFISIQVARTSRIVSSVSLTATGRDNTLRVRNDDKRFCHPVIKLGLRPNAAIASPATSSGFITRAEIKRRH